MHAHYIHNYIQLLCRWTGSNTNPNNNAGQGRAGTDRSNIVLLRDTTYTEVARKPNENKFGHFARSYPTHLDAEQNGSYSFLGWDRESRQSLAMLSPSMKIYLIIMTIMR